MKNSSRLWPKQNGVGGYGKGGSLEETAITRLWSYVCGTFETSKWGRKAGVIRSFPVLRSVGQGREASGSCEQADLYHALLWTL